MCVKCLRLTNVDKTALSALQAEQITLHDSWSCSSTFHCCIFVFIQVSDSDEAWDQVSVGVLTEPNNMSVYCHWICFFYVWWAWKSRFWLGLLFYTLLMVYRCQYLLWHIVFERKCAWWVLRYDDINQRYFCGLPLFSALCASSL